MNKEIILVELVTRIEDYGQSSVQCVDTGMGLIKALGPRDYAPNDAELIIAGVHNFSYLEGGLIKYFKMAWSPEFEKELGVTFDIIERQGKEVENLRMDCAALEAVTNIFNDMSFWQRVKFAFTKRVV